MSRVRKDSELLDSASLGVTRRVKSRMGEILCMWTQGVIGMTRRVESVRGWLWPRVDQLFSRGILVIVEYCFEFSVLGLASVGDRISGWSSLGLSVQSAISR